MLNRPSRLRRFFGFLIFRIVPLLLILGIIWSGYNIAQAVARRVNEQLVVSQRSAAYVETATAIAPTITTFTPTSSVTPTVTATSTDTLTPTLTETATATLTYTLTPSDTATVTSSPTSAAIAQVFATNTPRQIPITLPAVNTPAAAIESATEIAPSPVELTPTFTETATVAMTPTLPLTPNLEITATPPPLPTFMALGDPDANTVAVTAIPTRVPQLDRQGNDLVNILLLGSDEQITNDGFVRTDTMIIVSINRTTGTVAMLSLPRDLFVYIPAWNMQRLNLAYSRGQAGGWNDGTFELLRQTIFYNFGINVHYYALINLSGFKEIVDTVGGIEVAVDCAIQDYPLIEAEVPAAAYRSTEDGKYTLPVGYYMLNGAEALWYARSRGNSDDFDRGRRQQQVLRAVWRKARDTGQLAQLPQLWNQGLEIVETNLGFEDMLTLLPVGLSLDSNDIENFAFKRLYHTTPWQTPDGDYVQLPIYDTMRQLLEDFYTPPTQNQLVVEGASIAVYNGTNNENWDRVAAGRLGWGGLNAIAAGAADRTDYVDTILIDHTGQSKGSSLQEIANTLNVKPENVLIQPDPNRQMDFEVIVGSNYNSCTYNVLPPEEDIATPAQQ